MVPLAKNQGVCFALMSYNGRVNFGLTADYDAMPDLDALAGDLEASIAELTAAAPSAGVGGDGEPAAASAGSRPQPSTRSSRSRVRGGIRRRKAAAQMAVPSDPVAMLSPDEGRRRVHPLGAPLRLVLLLILCSLVFQLAAADQDWARVVTIALQGGALVLALYASQARPLIARLATVVVALAVLGSAAALIGFGEFGATAGRIVAALLVALAPLAIVQGSDSGVRTEGAVTICTRCSGSCASTC